MSALRNRFVFSSAFCLSLMGVLALACSGSTTQDVLLVPEGGIKPPATDSSSGTPNPTGCSEQEPNNDPSQANELSPSRCGNLSSSDKVDFLTFTLAPTTKTMSIKFTGRVRLRVDVEGKPTTELTPDNAGIVPFVMGTPYTIEVTPLSSSGSSDVPWTVEVVEK